MQQRNHEVCGAYRILCHAVDTLIQLVSWITTITNITDRLVHIWPISVTSSELHFQFFFSSILIQTSSQYYSPIFIGNTYPVSSYSLSSFILLSFFLSGSNFHIDFFLRSLCMIIHVSVSYIAIENAILWKCCNRNNYDIHLKQHFCFAMNSTENSTNVIFFFSIYHQLPFSCLAGVFITCNPMIQCCAWNLEKRKYYFQNQK
jgi:hypothetical protein